ncbi:hypothetical protein [Synechococcus sp. CBW1107]|uniref:hypothetical protein n=1 Tax=Synechococcus sp. CBW1107 TaxID=2789857 RepID=UPI002AD316B2|nr:hypothetical protein [Synechococcus sp. CBW1107]
MSARHDRTPGGSGARHPGRVWLLGQGSVRQGLASIGSQGWAQVVSAALPPAQGSCPAPVWEKQVSVWRHDPWRIQVVSVGLPPEPGFALVRASGHQARGCTGADVIRRIDLGRNGDRQACESLR